MKHDGYYYLLAAEGGTGAGHRISAARSRMCGALMKTVPITRFCARMTRAAICRTAAMASCCRLLTDGGFYASSACAAIQMARPLWDGKLRLQK